MKLSDLIRLLEKKKCNCSEELHQTAITNYNLALSDLANMEIEVDEEAIKETLKDFSKHIHIATLSKMGSASACEEFAKEADTFLNKALYAIASQLPKIIKRKK